MNLDDRSSCLGVVIAGENTSVKSASVKSLAVPRYDVIAFFKSSSLRSNAARNFDWGAYSAVRRLSVEQHSGNSGTHDRTERLNTSIGQLRVRLGLDDLRPMAIAQTVCSET